MYASEFIVINSVRKDTVLVYSALQNCRIDKTEKNSLVITECSKLPFGDNFEWIDCDYLRYVLTETADGRIKVDTTFVLHIPRMNEDSRSAICKKYNQVLKKKSKVTEELSFQILLLALNDDEKGRDILFNMMDKLNLDGDMAEMNSEALDIYKNYLRSFTQIKIGKINDPDGYANVRKEPNSKSKIVVIIKENEPFEYIENGTDWWWITKLDGSKGFVHRSRIKEQNNGIIFNHKVYNDREFAIKVKKVKWNKLIVLAVNISPKDERYISQTDSNNIAECSSLIRVYLNNSEINNYKFINIDAAGGCAGISFPKEQASEKYLFGCKYGEYNGRLIQIDEDGKITTYAGGNYFVTKDNRFLVSVWDSDMPGITVVDMYKGIKYFEKEFEDQFYSDTWFELGGEYYALPPDYKTELPVQGYKLNLEDKSFKAVTIDLKLIKKFTKLKLLDDFPEITCNCGR
ncbi:MAG TPA: SH3 domain-containing protein [Ignavibacteriales bacterium]|nr:SH3 domain-containing protein [Ignavibacteriales bacterium]